MNPGKNVKTEVLRKEIDTSGEIMLKEKNPWYVSLVGHVMLGASQKKLRESGFFHNVNQPSCPLDSPPLRRSDIYSKNFAQTHTQA